MKPIKLFCAHVLQERDEGSCGVSSQFSHPALFLRLRFGMRQLLADNLGPQLRGGSQRLIHPSFTILHR